METELLNLLIEKQKIIASLKDAEQNNLTHTKQHCEQMLGKVVYKIHKLKNNQK